MHARRVLRAVTVAAATGALAVTVAWAGAGLAPVDTSVVDEEATNTPGLADDRPTSAARIEEEAVEIHANGDAPGQPAPGEFLVGAAKISIEPRPEDYDGTWAKEGCATFGEDADQAATHVADFRVKWPENPDCVYMGGYGIGPMNPITSWDEDYGLHVRSLAISDGDDTIVLTLVDGVSYFGEYRDMCDGCGAYQLAQTLGERHGFDPAGFILASTHSHTAPDFIGGWGGVPDWYMQQVTDTIATSVADAITGMRSAVIEVGESFAREFSGERRDFYRSAEDPSLTWLRAYVRRGTATAQGSEVDGDVEVVATLGAFAAHPVTASADGGMAHGDFPAVFAHEVERDGGIGFFFQTGLGNMSPRGDTVDMGTGLAQLVGPVGSGVALTDTEVAAAQTFWDQPVTNSGLTALGLPGFFDRPFAERPSSVHVGSEPYACTSASPVSVNVAVSAARVGDLTVTASPGEIFANISNTLAEKAPGKTLALAQANDGLGYLMQSFETDHAGRQGVGFVGEVAEYEDAYSIDHCFGEMALETTLQLMGSLHR